MSFARQWFHPSMATGLSKESQEFEESLCNRDLITSQNIIERMSSKNLNPSDARFWLRQRCRFNRISKKLENGENCIRICFLDFWPDFDPNNNQLLDLIRHSCSKLRVEPTGDASNADIAIYSCYGNNSATFKYTKYADRWLFLGENVRPQFYDYDLSLSFDDNSYLGKNIQLPLWMLEIDWFGKSYKDRKPLKLRNFASVRSIDYQDRKNSVVFIGNNAEPLRESLLTEITNMGVTVDRFGSQTKPVTDKIRKMQEYKVVLATENSFSPGYVTEKIMHAACSGAHVIYYGSISTYRDFNEDAPYILNYIGDDANKEKLAEFIRKAFTMNNTYKQEPLISRQFVIQRFYDICSTIRRKLQIYDLLQ